MTKLLTICLVALTLTTTATLVGCGKPHDPVVFGHDAGG